MIEIIVTILYQDRVYNDQVADYRQLAHLSELAKCHINYVIVTLMAVVGVQTLHALFLAIIIVVNNNLRASLKLTQY